MAQRRKERPKVKPKAYRTPSRIIGEQSKSYSSDESLESDLELIHGLLRNPLGTDPDRDKAISSAWRSKQ